LDFLRFNFKFFDRPFELETVVKFFLPKIKLLIRYDKIIKTILPDTTGNKIKSYETSANKAISGLAAAGGWIIFKYIINVTQRPTDKPNETNEIPT
tara:strand:- start:23 stop:310 length:288 start_codon:yes stop_codon:yes gene_type:complete